MLGNTFLVLNHLNHLKNLSHEIAQDHPRLIAVQQHLQTMYCCNWIVSL